MNPKKLVNFGLLFVAIIILTTLGVIFFEVWIDRIELVTLIGAISGLIKLIYESNKTRKLKEAEFISNLNRDFTTNEHICSLYRKLEHDYRYPEEPSTINKDDVLSFVVYFTFFETLYDFIKKKIIDIKNIDDLFGYRFFIILHNKTVQDVELTAKITIASYVNIYNLYNIWLKYRISQCKKNKIKIKDSIVMFDHNLYDCHPEVIEYLDNPIPKTTLELATRKDVLNVYRLQKSVYKKMIRDGEKHLFQPSTFVELYTYYKNDMLFVKKGAFGIIGYIGVLSMDKTPYLSSYVTTNENTYVIDTVVVSISHRGLGIQKELIDYVVSLPQFKQKTWIATTDPNNKVSIKNFQALNFKVTYENISLYNNKNRHILQLKK